MKEKESVETKIWKIAFWVVVAIFLLIFIWYILGDSPTLEQALLVFVLGLSIANAIHFSSASSDIRWLKTENVRLINDFAEIKRGITK